MGTPAIHAKAPAIEADIDREARSSQIAGVMLQCGGASLTVRHNGRVAASGTSGARMRWL
jgi:hypothetical protein